jgi:hypothetical protein
MLCNCTLLCVSAARRDSYAGRNPTSNRLTVPSPTARRDKDPVKEQGKDSARGPGLPPLPLAGAAGAASDPLNSAGSSSSSSSSSTGYGGVSGYDSDNEMSARELDPRHYFRVFDMAVNFMRVVIGA